MLLRPTLCALHFLFHHCHASETVESARLRANGKLTASHRHPSAFRTHTHAPRVGMVGVNATTRFSYCANVQPSTTIQGGSVSYKNGTDHWFPVRLSLRAYHAAALLPFNRLLYMHLRQPAAGRGRGARGEGEGRAPAAVP